MASDTSSATPVPRHIAVIMDGNGRWAKQRGLPRLAGHRAGTENIRRIVTECANLGVRYLTLFAFSTENWSRPTTEVSGLMRILGEFIDREISKLHAEQVQVRHLGHMDRLSPHLQKKIRDGVALTANNTRLTLAVALNYGGRSDILEAARSLVAAGVRPEDINEQMFSAHLATRDMPDPDLIIRTSGEWRLSNFLLWQAAYSEYWMTPLFWPDFGPEHLRQAVQTYGQRERRFGGLSEE